MKTYSKQILATGFFVILTSWAYAQGFVAHVNDVHMNFKGEPINATLPEIVWVSPRLESSFSAESKIKLEVTVTSREPLKELKLVLKMGGGEERSKPFTLKDNETSKTIVQELTLLDGENILEIVATNIKGGKVSSERSVISGKGAVTDLIDVNRKDYALIFATDKYENFGELVNPVDDSRTIQGILKEKYGFETEIVENPTYEEVLAKIYDYNTRKFNKQDQLFIFFAGHGVFDDVLGEGYIVATNSLANDKGKGTYISHTTLRNNVDNVKCDHIFLTMDVCFGGTFDPKLARERSADAYAEATDAEIMMRKLSKRTRKYLTSGSKTYVSDGIAGKHSPFAAKFIEALRTTGDGKDRLLTLSELQPYFLKLTTEARTGSFGTDETGSDFVFVAKQN